jgi:hypothetical protein
MECLILLSPIENIKESLGFIYTIINTHYFELKELIKHKVLSIYFEVYVMGIEEGMFDSHA